MDAPKEPPPRPPSWLPPWMGERERMALIIAIGIMLAALIFVCGGFCTGIINRKIIGRVDLHPRPAVQQACLDANTPVMTRVTLAGERTIAKTD